MLVLFVLGIGLIALAIVLFSMALGPSQPAGGINRSIAVLQAMTEAPKELRGELEPSFADRVIKPLRERALGLGRRLTGADTAERYRRKLDKAGNPAEWTVDKIVSGKVLVAGTGLLVGLAVALLLDLSLPTAVLVAGGALALGFFAPDFYLYQRAYERSERIQRELADAIDLMTISVESGLGFDAAVQQVARNTSGPLAEEFARVLREMQLGNSRSEALRGLGERTDVEDVKGFVSSMVQADAFGIPIGQVLRVQSSEMRVKRRQRAEMKAQQVPVKITVPLIFFILPALFVAVMGPAVITMMDTMF